MQRTSSRAHELQQCGKGGLILLWIYQAGIYINDIVSYRQVRVTHRWWFGPWPNRVA
jgi:hypothetical protein